MARAFYLCQTVDSGNETIQQLACQATQGNDPESALAECLERLERGRHHQDAVRKAMVAIFDCLGDDHPLTKAYRRKMMMALF
ncbi:MAG: tetratricopeptide repeat protein [Elainellaceae cyanobacterium]